MGLFSRKKKSDDGDDARREESPAPEATDGDQSAEAAGEPTPEVNISFSSFRGVGAGSGPARDAPGAAADAAPADPPAPAARPSQGTPARELPLAPAAPPAQVETVKGLRDNTLLRDALAALPEKPTPAQLLGVARQLLHGHIFLRVTGDVREQIEEGGRATLSFGVAKNGDKSYMLVFSSGRALSDAVKADGNQATSAVAQPVGMILRHMIDNGFDGLIVDGASAPRRIVLPREVLERALGQADPELRVKAALAQPRDTDTPKKVAAVLAERPPLWVAVGPSPDDESKMGIAEARLANGTRLLQVYSHPLEVVAQGRTERAMPFGIEKIARVLVDHPELGGLLLDPAGPLITLTREELDPVLALAADAGEDPLAAGD
ncbi:SseB family protein [Microbacterium excoecariae]|uniref:SseB family protein n=1 Tax=Microbacterium excoecariae TaxID=2715210 RepID=UPI0014089216|nr:SseB family protein [Microbacterium excoecariae]NHI17626.1 SseB family protein [Microbacterium excoecariae]